MRKFDGFIKGVNLGGWFSQNELTIEHLNNFIKRDDIEYIHSLGMDHVRIPIDFELIEDEEGNEIEQGYAYIDQSISWCFDYHLNVILDLHKTAGYVFDDPSYSQDFFENEPMQERFINLWKRLARRYGQHPNQIAFELLNEVVSPKAKDAWNRLAKRTIQAIREIAPEVFIILGGTRSNSVVTIKDLGVPYDQRIVYNFHCYEPLMFTHQGAYWVANMPKDYKIDYPLPIEQYISEAYRLIDHNFAYPIEHLSKLTDGKEFFESFFSEALEIAKLYDVPLYCGEYGVIDGVDSEAMLRWFQDIHSVFETYGIGRAVWNYKEKDFGITSKHNKPMIKELIKYL